MRELKFDDIVKSIRDCIMYSGTHLPKDALDKMNEAYENEKNPVAKEVLRQLLENADIASSEARPLCQDTGLAVFFVKVGEDLKVVGGTLREAINEGTKQGYTDACIKSKAIYFGATGGAGALLSRQIKKADVIAYPELGPEAIRRLEVVDFPLTVINDTYGQDLYKIGRAQYEVK